MSAMVTLQGVGVRFRVPIREPRAPSAWFPRAAAWPRWRNVEALRDVSLSIETGSVVAVVGANGAGKSTLLRVIAGTIPPSSGWLEVPEPLGSLVSLSAGFRSQLTGRENVILAGTARGLSRARVIQRMDAIVDFAEIRDSIDLPVSTYSSGMSARLAFAVATDSAPNLLLIDEALAVGDKRFQEKAIDRISELIRRSSTVLIAAHSLDLLRDLCSDAVWMHGGRIRMYGPAKDTIDAYETEMTAR